MANVKLVDQYFKAFNKHDPEAVAALFGRSGIYRDSALPAGVKAEALKQYLAAHYEAFPDSRYKVLSTMTSRDGMVAFEWRFKATNTGPLGGSPATNRAVDILGCSFMQAKNGAIAWLHGYFDRRGMMKQLGL